MPITPQDFPVKVTKGTGKDKVTRTAHSIIAFRQLETEGYTLAGGSAKAADSDKSEAKDEKADKADPKPANTAKK